MNARFIFGRYYYATIKLFTNQMQAEAEVEAIEAEAAEASLKSITFKILRTRPETQLNWLRETGQGQNGSENVKDMNVLPSNQPTNEPAK